MNKKSCIVHIPYKLIDNAKSAPMLRPRKMIEGFLKLGYEIDVVCGDSKERKKRIEAIRTSIERGKKYDFMYAESSTMPSILTDSSHFPKHPFMDFSFFKFIKKHGIRIGLFYRDIYWRFPLYKKGLPLYKYTIGIMCYEYEMRCYNKYVDLLYFPTLGFSSHLGNRFTNMIDELPPACDPSKDTDSYRQYAPCRPLNILYIGGIGKLYNIVELVKAIRGDSRFQLTICCREDEWRQERKKYDDFLSNNIHIVHKNNNELEELYKDADICSLVFETDEYRKITIPYKSFEYLGHYKPSLSSTGTAISRFIKQNGIGWEVECEEHDIRKCLEEIISNPTLLSNKREKCIQVAKKNSWECRAKKVSEDLRKKDTVQKGR